MNLMRAFSLVELSIVLVILGLLVGGVLSGQSLIRASELRAATAEYQRYYTAAQAFRDKYFAIPGDFNNAQAFWGQSTACGGASATGTCNGNGDGQIGQPGGAAATGENFQFWRQLAFAGLVEGNYTGVSGPASASDVVIGTNTPKSKMSNSGWSALYSDNSGGATPNIYKIKEGNMFIFGAQSTGNWNGGANMKPEELWNIDTKIDDGLPGSGKLIAYVWNTGCTNAATFSDFTSPYNLSNSALVCAAMFINQF